MGLQQITDRENLQRSLVLAQQIYLLCGTHRQSNPSHLSTNANTFSEAIPPIILAIPNEITQSLVNSGCTPTVARSLSDAFIRSSHGIRAKYESLYHETCQKWINDRTQDPNSPNISGLHSIIERRYQNQLHIAEQLAVDRGRTLSKTEGVMEAVKSKPAFNQEFVPLLEKYFEYNPYPPAADRAALARKSMMTARQIEVWFQNHRNRAKKEGKVLHRNSLDLLPHHISLHSLEKSMPFFVIPETERKLPLNKKVIQEKGDADSEEGSTTATPPVTLRTSFSSTAPLHAFPVIYPPRCDHDPFPIKTGQYKFPSPEWPRKPSTSRPASESVNFEEFIQDFTFKLSLREPAPRKPMRKLDPYGRLPAPWFAATCTITPPAPHPAFVRSNPFTSLTPSSHPSVPIPPACHHAFRSSRPCAPPAFSIPTVTPIRRKVARLPNRTPKNPNMSHRHGSPVISEASPAPSRSSSFGSDASPSRTHSSRRPSSSSGSSSSSSSTLTTPVLSNSTLPQHVHPVSVAGLDQEHINNLFRHSAESVSLNEGIPIPATSGSKDLLDLDFAVPFPDQGVI